MAASDLTVEFLSPMKAVIGAAASKLEDANQALESVRLELRGAPMSENAKTRRTVLRSMRAAGAVAAVPAGVALAIPAAALAAPDDAEILALAAEIQILQVKKGDIKATRVDPVDDEWHALAVKDWKAACAFGDASSREAAVREVNELDERGDSLCERIKALPATTQAGRAAKVRTLLTHMLGDGWRGPAAEVDCDKEQARALLAEFAGMTRGGDRRGVTPRGHPKQNGRRGGSAAFSFLWP